MSFDTNVVAGVAARSIMMPITLIRGQRGITRVFVSDYDSWKDACKAALRWVKSRPDHTPPRWAVVQHGTRKERFESAESIRKVR